MRAIDADKLNEEIEELKRKEDENKYGDLNYWDALDTAGRFVFSAPTIDPVRHGHWETHICDPQLHCYDANICSECGVIFEGDARKEFFYCPRCGAKMDEKE